MPEKKTIEAAERDKEEGKAPSTQAGEFIKEQMDHIREGKHGARSTKQAIAIGLSEARRAGVDLPAPKGGRYSQDVKDKAGKDLKAGEHPHAPNPKRSRASEKALQREGKDAASHAAISRQVKSVANQKSKSERSAIAKKAAATRKRNETN